MIHCVSLLLLLFVTLDSHIWYLVVLTPFHLPQVMTTRIEGLNKFLLTKCLHIYIPVSKLRTQLRLFVSISIVACVCVCFISFNFWHWKICSWRSMERPAQMYQAIKQYKYFLPCWHQRLSPGKYSGRLRGMWSNSGRCPWRAELFWVGLCLSNYSQVRLIM